MMNQQFEQQLRRAVCAVKPPAPLALNSATVWQHLVDQGITVAPGAMDAVFTTWEQQALITSARAQSQATVEQYGARTITSISPELCAGINTEKGHEV